MQDMIELRYSGAKWSANKRGLHYIYRKARPMSGLAHHFLHLRNQYLPFFDGSGILYNKISGNNATRGHPII
jgi:hypothetical protein